MINSWTEHELILALKDSNCDYENALLAFNVVNDLLMIHVINFAENLLHDQNEAEEIAAHSFGKFFEAVNDIDFNSLQEVRAFVYGTAITACAYYLEQIKIENSQAYYKLYQNFEDFEYRANKFYYHALLEEAFYNEVENLSDLHRDLFVLIYLRRFSLLDVSKKFNLSSEEINRYCLEAISQLSDIFSTKDLCTGILCSNYCKN